MSILLGVSIWLCGFLDTWLISVLIVFCAAASSALFQYYRSHYKAVLSQISQQLWKVLALLALTVAVIYEWPLDIDVMVFTVMLINVILAASIVFRYRPVGLAQQSPETITSLYSIGFRFLATGLLLSLSVYGEQLLVNRLGGQEQGALYFTHATYFLFPASVLSGYFSFLIGPWARDNHDKYVGFMRERRHYIFVGTFLYSALVNFVGWFAWGVVSPVLESPDIVLQVLFFVICFFRTIYMWPGAYVGIFGKPKEHDVLVGGHLLALLVAIVALCFLIQGKWLEMVYVIAISSAVNWTLRAAAASSVTRIIIKNRSVHE